MTLFLAFEKYHYPSLLGNSGATILQLGIPTENALNYQPVLLLKNHHFLIGRWTDSRFTNSSLSSPSSFLCTQNCPKRLCEFSVLYMWQETHVPSNMFPFAIKSRSQSVLVVSSLLKMISHAVNRCLAVEYAHLHKRQCTISNRGYPFDTGSQRSYHSCGNREVSCFRAISADEYAHCSTK